MRIKLESVAVTDQDHALRFYTEVLGFVKKQDIPMGDARFLTVVSPDEPDAAELMLEPSGEHPPTKAFREALYSEGIPLTAFEVDHLDAQHRRLTGLGVEFKMDPAKMGETYAAILDDTCGNLIMLYEKSA